MKINWPYPKLFAHRGGGTLAPENTFAAMRKGNELGYKAVEFDVMLTADNIAVVIHDPQLGRTVKGTGEVSQMTYEQLAKLDAGSWFDSAYQAEPVPTLDTIVRYCCAEGIAMNIEIKPAPGYADQTALAIANALSEYQARFPLLTQPGFVPLVSSFSVQALQRFRLEHPTHPMGLLLSKMPSDWRDLAVQLNCQAIHSHFAQLNADLVRDIKDSEFWLFCYTVNDPQVGRDLIDWGVDGFCTDRLDLFSDWL